MDYIKYGFIGNSIKLSAPMCLTCRKTLSIEATKPFRPHDHFNKMHFDNEAKVMAYFQNVEKNNVAKQTISKLLSTASKQDDGVLNKFVLFSFKI